MFNDLLSTIYPVTPATTTNNTQNDLQIQSSNLNN